MRKGWLAILLFVLFLEANAAVAALRIGLFHTVPPFAAQKGMPGILDDELSILFNNTPQPEILHFTSVTEGTEALKKQQIDVLISDHKPADYLRSSEPMLTFPLASLTLERGTGGTLCFPELPVNVTPPCTRAVSAQTGDNVQRLILGDAQRFIAPEFILRTWIAHAPATTLLLQPLENLTPLYFRGWALPNRLDALAELNEHIRAMNPEDARWLEEKWLLPAGSVFSARNPPASENAPRMMLRVLLPAAPAPLMQLTPDGHIHGVWHDLLLSLFPANHFTLSFGVAPPLTSQPKQSERANLRIVASQTSPSPDAIEFDSLNWGLISPSEKALHGTLSALQNRRIAVIRNSPVVPLLTEQLHKENLVVVKDISQGFELIRAGGADGLVGDAYMLNYALRQQEKTSLQLTPLGLPDTPLWFVPDISSPSDARRVAAILASVTKADIFSQRAKPLAILNEQVPSPDRSLWLIMLAVVSFCAVLISLITWSTAQRQRRQREQDTLALHNVLSLWQTLMNSAPVPLFVCDPSGRLSRYNEAFIHSPLLADVPGEGSPFARLPLGELANQLSLPERLNLLNADEPITGESRIPDNNKTLYWWLCRYADNLGRPQGIVGGWVDITEKAALTTALNKALEQAKRASREKSDFLARMSHDIRTPLNAVLGLLELEKERNDNLAVAWQTADSLRALIGDILDLSRIEAGELRLEQSAHDLWQTLNACEEVFSRTSTVKGLKWQARLDIPKNELFYFDKARLNQIIANLLGNAIKYTPHGEVRFYATFADEELQIRVSDTGIGIAPEAMPSIGQPWFQTDHTTPQSSGLGLAICYQLVELMSGTLAITSEPDVGTEVTVKLPLQPATVQELMPAIPEPAPLIRRRVMIVDDFPANLTVLTLQLEKLGQDVIACESANAALSYLLNDTVDILITDCQMPGIDGYQLTTLLLLRDIAGIASAPDIILGCTANALLEENARARHAGMDALLRKPLTMGELQQALVKHTGEVSDKCDLNGLYQLADGRPEIITLMRRQMLDALEQDLQQLQSSPPSAEVLSKLAHRLKSSWSLFCMRETTRRCQAMEALPELVSARLVEEAQLPTLTDCFSSIMRNSQLRLDARLGELSDKY